MHILIDSLPIALRRKIRLVVDAYILVLFLVLIPPGPALAVGGRVRERVQVLDGLPVGEGGSAECAGGVELDKGVGFAEIWLLIGKSENAGGS